MEEEVFAFGGMNLILRRTVDPQQGLRASHKYGYSLSNVIVSMRSVIAQIQARESEKEKLYDNRYHPSFLYGNFSAKGGNHTPSSGAWISKGSDVVELYRTVAEGKPMRIRWNTLLSKGALYCAYPTGAR